MCSLPKERTDRGEFVVHIYSMQAAGLDKCAGGKFPWREIKCKPRKQAGKRTVRNLPSR